MRQALIAQQRLHSSIFGSNGSDRWRTEQLGCHHQQLIPDEDYDLMAGQGNFNKKDSLEPREPARQLVVLPVKVRELLQHAMATAVPDCPESRKVAKTPGEDLVVHRLLDWHAAGGVPWTTLEST